MKTQQKLPVLKVLDLASPGNAMGGYASKFRPKVEGILIKAIDKQNKGEMSGKGKIILEKAYGLLPDCLCSEPSEHYDHVHFHMATTSFEPKKISETFTQVARITKSGGILFFSADGAFFSCTDYQQIKDNPQLTPYMHVNESMESAFSIVYRSFGGNITSSPIMTRASWQIGRMFGEWIGGGSRSAVNLFSAFSWYIYGKCTENYFAIAVKSDAKQPT